MAEEEYRAQQWDRRYSANVEAINLLCDGLSGNAGEGRVPYIDPRHDLDECRIVSLLASPGAGAGSGFIQRRTPLLDL
ncbi:hypothetical protein [Crystallibacter crystallopoietes]|uniref:hypothetical protein n=1 Tax=Crystallibacter crystallopoietes TaxID=37928 RepID=UPI0002E38F86|nr:hypothetical protein [Arthrobacter crystallopoietes]